MDKRTSELQPTNFSRMRFSSILVMLMMIAISGFGQVNISGGSTITEGFSIGTSATATLPTGWKVDKIDATARTVGSYASASTATTAAGSTNLSSSASNGIYNFGTTLSSAERAIGGLSSGSASKSVNLYVDLINNGTTQITSLNISYNVEKYRKGSNVAGFSIQMYYSTNGTSWTSAGSNFLTSFPADVDNNGYASAPGATVNISNQPLTILANPTDHIYLAWNYSVTSGTTTSNAQALSVDDVSITAVASITPTITTTGTLAALTTTYGTASSTTSFDVSGADMTAGISITPPSGFEVATSSDFSTTVGTSVSPLVVGAAGTISSTTIYVRLSATASAGAKSGNIVCSSAGAVSRNVATTSSTVNPKGLTISGITADSKTYTGTPGATLSGTAVYAGLVNGESFSVTGTPVATFASVHVGNGISVSVSGYTAPSANYTVTQPSLSANITEAALTITANDVTKPEGSVLSDYSGSTAFSSSGLQNSETIGSVSITYGAAGQAGAAIGIYSGQVTPSAASGGTFTATDYAITYVSGSIEVVSASTPVCPESVAITPTANQTICEGVSASALTAAVTTAGIAGTPSILYQWYYNTTNSNALSTATAVSGATSSSFTPASTASEIGERFYFCVAYASDNSCGQTGTEQSLASNVVKVTVNSTPAVPAGSTSQSFCAAANPTVASLVVSGTNVQWFSSNVSGTPLLSTAALSNGSYFAESSLNGCSSARLEVVVSITSTPSAPVTTAQTVCNGSTVASLTATGTDIKWYDAFTAGNLLSSSAVVSSGSYFASQSVNGCESSRASSFVTVLPPFSAGNMVSTSPLSNLVISQVYGGGGNSGATYTHDFIEIFNPTVSAVSLSGWSVQYASATGSSWATVSLSGTIQAGAYYLVQLGSTASVGLPLPTPNATGTIAMSATNGKVALVNATAALNSSTPSASSYVDLVGFGTATYFEGSAATASPSNTTSIQRYAAGYTDTNNNGADFFTATPSPRNSATPVNAGEGSLNQSVCSTDALPRMSVEKAGGSGSFSYQWYSHPGIVSCPTGSDVTGWTSLGSADGASTALYIPAGTLSASTTYACLVTPAGSPTCGSAAWANGCRQFTVSPPLTWYADLDEDGFGDLVSSTLSCTAPPGYVLDNNDCDDSNASVNENGTEVCNGVDDDCNGNIDDIIPSPYYVDVDHDGFGAAGTSVVMIGCGDTNGYSVNDEDCDDGDPTINPGETEICNETDDDCDGLEDEGVTITWYADADGDTYGNPATTVQACYQPTGYTADNSDCDDTDDTVHPDATETCNSIDDDCDGDIDDVTPTSYWADVDGDSYGDAGSMTSITCGSTVGFVTNDEDCDDGDPDVSPDGTEVCNQTDDDCDGTVDEGVTITWYADTDGDTYGDPAVTQNACFQPVGYTADNSDCDDDDASVNPDATEVCNTLDDDCDGDVDDVTPTSYWADVDGDTYGDAGAMVSITCGSTVGYVINDEDCDDGDPSIHPGAIEVCNDTDDDCDGLEDEGVEITWYADADGDSYGNPAVTQNACFQPTGYTADNSDCNDNDSSIHPDAVETCDGEDEDCDGDVDDVDALTYFADVDGDTYGDPSSATLIICQSTSGYVLNDGDCDDGDPTIYPGATEVCNGTDDDCDGLADEGVLITWYADTDGDSYGNPAVSQQACYQPFAYTADNSDCDDTDGAVHPDAVEVCNGIDDDCDAQIDNVPSTQYYADVDQDGYGDPASGVAVECTVPAGYILNNSDCDDGDPSVYPGATEVCNQQDDNCNGTIDEGVALPVALCRNLTVYLDAAGSAVIDTAMINNGSYAACGIAGYALSKTSFNCSEIGTNTVVFTVTDFNGQSNSCSATVTVLDTIKPVLSACPASFTASITCDGMVSWTPPVASDNCTASLVSNIMSGSVFTAGSTVVTYTAADASGNTATCSFTVTVIPFTISMSGSDALCDGSADGSASVSTSNTQGAVTYLWSNGASTASITGLTAGTYTVTVTNGTCVLSSSYTVGQPAELELTSQSQTNILCFGGNNGAAAVSVTGGTAPYTYLWSDGSNGTSLSGLTAGTYTCTVTDAHNCTDVLTFTITSPAALSLTTGAVQNVNCNGDATGSAGVNVSGGTGPYSYLWNNGQTSATATDLSAGTYSVIVTDANNCTASHSVSVLENALLVTNAGGTAVSCFGGNDGTASVTVIGGTAPYTYMWSDGSATNAISGLIAGTYTVTVSDFYNCTSSATYTVTEPAVLTVTLTADSVNCNGGTDGSISTSISGGNSAFSYLWSDGQLTANASTLVAGTYSVTVTDNKGCSATAAATVGQPASITVSENITSINCNGASTGAITLSVSGGVPGYSYNWSNGATSRDLSGIAAGTYTVTVLDFYGCTSVHTYSVTQNTAITVTPTIVNLNCRNVNHGSVAVSVTGGTPSYTYLWSNGQTGSSLINLAAGTYTVTITDALGCTAVRSYTVTQPAASSITTSIVNASCFGAATGSITINANGGTPPYSYLWSNGQTTATATALVAGFYQGTVTDANGCQLSVVIASVSQPTQIVPVPTITNAACNGGTGTVILSTSGGVPGYTYVWSNGVTGNSNTTIAGTYTVTITDATGCSRSLPYTITEPAAVSVVLSSQTNVSCHGGSNGSVTVAASGGTGAISLAWSNGQTGTTVTGLLPGTYTVTATDANSCTGTLSVTITEPTLLTATTSVLQTISCGGGSNGSVQVTAGGGTTPYTYLWSNGVTTAVNSGIAAGTYTATVTDGNGCTKTASVTLTNPLAVTASVSTTQSCNGGSTGTATVTPLTGLVPFTYVWSTGSTTATITGRPAGTYTVTVTDNRGCSIVLNAVITQPAALAVSHTVTQISCSNTFNGALAASVSGGIPGYTYLWSNGQVTSSISGLSGGTFTVTVTDNLGCTAQATTTLVTPTALGATATRTNVTCFGLANGTATANPTGGTPAYNYLWSNGQTTQTINNLGPGFYTVTVTDSRGCGPITRTVVVSQPAQIAIATTVTNVSCNGGSNGSVTATASAGVSPYTYVWSTGTTGQTASGLTAGTYTVTVTGANGCTNTRTVTVTQPAVLSVATTVTNVSCFNGANGSVAVTVTGGSTPYTYLWSNGQTTANINGKTAGNYTLTVTDANGCTANTSVTIAQPAQLVASSVYGVINCNGGTTTVTVFATGGTAPYSGTGTFPVSAGAYSFTVTDANGCTAVTSGTISQPSAVVANISAGSISCNGGSTTITVTGSGGTGPYLGEGTFTVNAGPYSYTVTDANGCTGTVSGTITEPAILTAAAQEGSISCNGGSTNVIITATGGTAPYSGTGSYTVSAGSYSYTVTDNNGCAAVVSGNITEPTALVASSVAGTISCNGGTTSVTVSATGGTLPYSGTGTFTVAAGNYSYIVTDGNGCTSVTSGNIAEPTPIVVTAVPGTILCNGGSTTIVVTASGSTAPYSGEGTFIVTAGPYSYTITDTNGCTSVVSGVVTEPAVLSASANAGTISCNGGTTTIVVSASGGTAPYSGTGTFTAAVGPYTYTVTDNNGCTSVVSGVVTEPAVLTASANAGTISCNGGTTTVVVSATGGTTPYSGTGTFTVNAGPYSYTVTDNNGCTSVVSGVVTEPAVLAASANAGTISCNGGTTTIVVSATGGTAPYSGTGTFTVTAGPYSYTVTDNNGCTSIASGVVTEPAVLAASINAGSIGCNGGTTTLVVSATGGTAPYSGTGTFTVTAGPYSYTVTDNNGCTSVVSGVVTQPTALVASAVAGTINCNGGSTTVVVTASGGTAPYSGTGTFTVTAGPYSYTVTDNNGCTSVVSGVITQPAVLVASHLAGTITCNGGTTTVVVSATGGTTPYSGTGSYVVSAGAYSFTVTDANGCSSTVSGFITEPSLLTASSSANGTIACYGGTTTVTVTASGGTAPYSGTGTFTAGAGVNTYMVTDANGCTATTTVTIAQPAALPTPVISGTFSLCYVGGGTTTFTATPVSDGLNPTFYSWTVPIGFNIVSGQGTTTLTVSWTPLGIDQTIKGQVVCNAFNVCTSSSGSATVSYSNTIAVTPNSVSGPTRLCPGDVATYSIAPVYRASSYVWSAPAGITITSGQGSNIIQVSVGAGYTGGNISVSSVNACGTSPARLRATILNILSAPGTISGTTTGLCLSEGQTYSIPSLAGATSYTWTVPAGATIMSGQGTTSIEVNFGSFTTGSITVMGHNACGSGAVRSLSVSGLPARPLDITRNDLVPMTQFVCQGATVVYQIPTVPGADSYNWVVSSGGTILAGQGSKFVTVYWSTTATGSQTLFAQAINSCGASSYRTAPVTVALCSRVADAAGAPLALSVYPNPANSNVHVEFNAASAGQYLLKITDLAGRAVVERAGESHEGLNKVELDVTNVPSGIYFVVVEAASTREIIRLMVE